MAVPFFVPQYLVAHTPSAQGEDARVGLYLASLLLELLEHPGIRMGLWECVVIPDLAFSTWKHVQ